MNAGSSYRQIRKLKWRKGMQKVLLIAGCWTLILVFIYINEYLFLTDLLDLEKVSGAYAFWPDFFGNLILSIFGGIIGGYILIFKMPASLRKKSFAYGLFRTAIGFVVVFLLIAFFGLFFMGFFFFLFQTNSSSAFVRALENVYVNMYTISFATNMTTWGLIFIGTQFMLQVNDKFGQGVLWRFITGRYFNPREEARIFMFLDLRSSTTIAEKLNNIVYFEFLREIYADITEPIVDYAGEIYQYVGDEVIVSWRREMGVGNLNCLNCFYGIKKCMEDKSGYYLATYGFKPSFKAGMHFGRATVGELGILKKEIVYSGDVLNTTSRIQELCNFYGKELLISSNLLSLLGPAGEFISVPLGPMNLRGKHKSIGIHAIEPA
jgi:adenylate cyclase